MLNPKGRGMLFSIHYGVLCLVTWCVLNKVNCQSRSLPCGKSGDGQLKYIWGDALDNKDCVGPDGLPYPREAVESIVQHSLKRTLQKPRQWRSNRSAADVSSPFWGSTLLSKYLSANGRDLSRYPGISKDTIPDRLRRVLCSPDGDDSSREDRLCQSEYNTTAPLFGVSMTSGETVAIVQKFPELLQQIVYEKCTTKKCQVIRGTCEQTFVPYLLLTVPLGPVTLTGQDYVLVESGCVCKPKPLNADDDD